jgi:hypothetical protein
MNDANSDENLIKALVSMQEASTDYEVPENVISEVNDYFAKISDPNLTREDWLLLIEQMTAKEKEDSNYELARLELTGGNDSSLSDPDSMARRIKDLRTKLSRKGIN